MAYVHETPDGDYGRQIRDSFASLAASAPDSCPELRKFFRTFVNQFDREQPEGDDGHTLLVKALEGADDAAYRRAELAVYRAKADLTDDPGLRAAYTIIAMHLENES